MVPALGQSQGAPDAVAAWRAANERRILDELVQLVALPNVARNEADMQANAALLVSRVPTLALKGISVPPNAAPLLLILVAAAAATTGSRSR